MNYCLLKWRRFFYKNLNINLKTQDIIIAKKLFIKLRHYKISQQGLIRKRML